METKENVLRLLGTLVVAYEDGVQLGNLSDIYVDRKSSRITGISIKRGLPGFVTTSYLEYEAIRKIGKDVVIVTGEAAAKPLPSGVEKTSLKLLSNVRIATRAGQYVGKLFDVSVAVASGNIVQLVLSETTSLKVSPAAISIGKDIIVVPSDKGISTRKVPLQKTDVQKNVEAMADMLESATTRMLKAAKGTTDRVISTTKRTVRAAKKTAAKQAVLHRKTGPATKKVVRKTAKKSKAKRR